ncbi:MAG: hypothetical protein ABII79_07910 [bacterium]
MHFPQTPMPGGWDVEFASQSDSAIVLDTVYGLNSDGKLTAEQDIKFMMRWKYLAGRPIHRFANGFRVYSPDGATWQPIVLDTVSHGWPARFDLILSINYWSANGSGADTAGINGDAMMGSGIPAPFDATVWWIETKVYQANVGDTLCIDSSFQPPPPATNPWLWTEDIGSSFVPGWSGPHCFEIAGCCNHDGIRGDADYSMGLDVGDLTYLVAYLFQSGPAPPCLDEGDVDGSGAIDVGDLTYQVAYLFQSGPAPPPCP